VQAVRTPHLGPDRAAKELYSTKVSVEPVNAVYKSLTRLLQPQAAPVCYPSLPMRAEALYHPSVPVQFECPAGRIVRGNISQSPAPQKLECQTGQEYCQVACVVNAVIFKESYEAGEEIARGVAGGYCVMSEVGFVRRRAIFTAPPPPEPVDPTVPF
jgi:hypothetical protein